MAFDLGILLLEASRENTRSASWPINIADKSIYREKLSGGASLKALEALEVEERLGIQRILSTEYPGDHLALDHLADAISNCLLGNRV